MSGSPILGAAVHPSPEYTFPILSSFSRHVPPPVTFPKADETLVRLVQFILARGPAGLLVVNEQLRLRCVSVSPAKAPRLRFNLSPGPSSNSKRPELFPFTINFEHGHMGNMRLVLHGLRLMATFPGTHHTGALALRFVSVYLTS